MEGRESLLGKASDSFKESSRIIRKRPEAKAILRGPSETKDTEDIGSTDGVDTFE